MQVRATVLRLLFASGKRVRGVLYSDSGRITRAEATGGVILSAGQFSSRILELSGIGNEVSIRGEGGRWFQQTHASLTHSPSYIIPHIAMDNPKSHKENMTTKATPPTPYRERELCGLGRGEPIDLLLPTCTQIRAVLFLTYRLSGRSWKLPVRKSV